MSASLGTVETARFAFTSRELTPAELTAFVAGSGLPVGVGIDVTTAKAEVEPPAGAATVTVQGGSIIHDGPGEYHFLLTMAAEGVYRWRGVGYNAESVQVSATPFFEVTCGEDNAATVKGLYESVVEDAQFDATEKQVLKWLDQRHRQMVARSRCYRRSLTVGPTVAGVAAYGLPQGIIEILQVTVGGFVYGSARHSDFAEGELGYIWLGGAGGIAGRDDSASGESLLRLFPAPLVGAAPEPGAAIVVSAAMQPPPLTVGQDSAIKIPDDYLDTLVAGAIATGMLRMESRPDIAAPHEQVFDAGCQELLRATNRKYRGTGPARIRVIGYNA